jgi:hypothetical protein
MPIARIRTPDGKIARFEVPEGTSETDIASFVETITPDYAKNIGAPEAFLIGAGKGFTTVGRGLGLIEPADETERAAMAALKEERPYTTGAGELVGEAAPFIPLGMGAGGIASQAGRVAATGAAGALEGGIIGKGEEVGAAPSAVLGGTFAMGAEMLFPVIGRLGRRVFQKVTGAAPKGAMLDIAGKPTAELQDALNKAGVSFDDLAQEAVETISRQKPGADPEQVARKALFAEEGIPATTGEVTRGFEQLTKEQRLLESPGEAAADPLRAFKLQQSEAIKERLRPMHAPGKEETGQLVQDALVGRKTMLRTQKNELYKEFADSVGDAENIPMFVDNIAESLPDTRTMERLGILDEKGVKELDSWLMRFGVKDPTPEMIEKGFQPELLSVGNFDDFRMGLNQISKNSDAIKVAVTPLKQALDIEADSLAETLATKGVASEIIAPLKQARKTVRQLKTEFSPQAVAGQLTGLKKDGFTQLTEASKVYDKLLQRSAPIENVRRVIASLRRSPDGESAIASLQSSTLLDLIDAGFGTESRKIEGVKVFNPIAFKRRLDAIGKDKIGAIFANRKGIISRLNNIDKISSELIPPAGAVPKGSASTILDLMNRLGLASISTNIPGGAFVAGSVSKIAGSVKKGVDVQKALRGDVDVRKMKYVIDQYYPGIASALAIPAIIEGE